ncbi:TetR/AcrR family transcriptional regulator [Brevibacillus borstelensis]|uniref:TetR/AcrR family transcriptional regulator n=1 Tax=Brevibacillus borstelensis TaxID=45462 RepID=UPI0030BAECF8
MPRTKEQNEEIRARRKQAILKGALSVYVEKGYAAADIGDVAERAGVARGLVYYYYKDKLSLFRDLFLDMFRLSNVHTRTHFSQEGSAVELCQQFAGIMFNNLFERSDHVLFFFRMRHDLRELFSKEEIKGLLWRDNNLKVMVDTLRKGMDAGEIRRMSPELLTDQFWGAMMHGMAHLRQRSDELLKQGRSLEEVKKLMETEIDGAALSCALMLRPVQAL